MVENLIDRAVECESKNHITEEEKMISDIKIKRNYIYFKNK